MVTHEGYRAIRLASQLRVERRVWPLSLLVAVLRFNVVLPHLDAPGRALLLLLLATLCAQGALLTRFPARYRRVRTPLLVHLKLCFLALQRASLPHLRLPHPTLPAFLYNLAFGTGALPSLLCSIGLQTTPALDAALAILAFAALRPLDVCPAVRAAGQQPAAGQAAAALQHAFNRALGVLLAVPPPPPPPPHGPQQHHPCACEHLSLFVQLLLTLALPLLSLVVLECQAVVLHRVAHQPPAASQPEPASMLEALCMQGPLLSALLLAAIAGVVWQAAGVGALLLTR